jgi:phage gp29-like protein
MSYFSDLWKTKNAIEKPVKRKVIEGALSERQNYRGHEDLETLEDAIVQSENVDRPKRTLLNGIYDIIEKDPHLHSQWENRKMKIIQREYSFKKGEEENEKIKEIFSGEWFHEFLHLAMDAKKYGFQLIAFGNWDGSKYNYSKTKDGFVMKPVRAINRNHVIPEKGIITKNSNDDYGMDVFNNPFTKSLLFLGDTKDKGFLFKCAKYILIKNNCLLNWSEFAEIFGHDLRVGKTETTGQKRKDFVNMLKKLASSGIGVMDVDDSIEFAGTSRSDAYQVYKELNEYVDKNISKVIFGQDVVSDMTGVTRGTAAENITDVYSEHDAKYLKGIINDSLIPKMIQHGVSGLDGGIRFDWVNTEELSLTEKSEIDLKISQMGFKHDLEYIEKTYNVDIEERTGEDVKQDLKNLYEE